MNIERENVSIGQLFKSRKLSGAMATVAILVLLPLAWLNPIDNQAEEYVKDGLKKALVTFAVARTANAVISLVQESTVSANVSIGVGASATIGLGQILDPINDLVENFSNLMLAACISFGIQMALLEIGRASAISIGLTVFLFGWAGALWLGRSPPKWLARFVVVLLVVRFAVPIAALGSELTYRTILGAKHEAAQAELGAKTGELENQSKQLQGAGWRDFLDTKVLKGFLDSMKSKADALVENAVRVMAVFIVQSILLPVLFLWLVVWLVRALFGAREGSAPILKPNAS